MVAVTLALAMVLSLFAFAIPASAAVNSSSITITTTNRGSIDNDTSARSYTGDNWAGGSQGGRGGDGGEVESDGANNNGGATSGDGGNGGNGGLGGLVDTGDADATADTENALNVTDAEVDLTSAAGDVNSTGIVVVTDNDREYPTQNHIDNDTRAKARTGDNEAEGSVGGNADDAGDIEGGDDDFNNGGAESGNGGDGGAGSTGGTVLTGRADSLAGTINVLNAALVRVRI